MALRDDSSESGSAAELVRDISCSTDGLATEEMATELPTYEYVEVPGEESIVFPPPMNQWTRLGPQPTKRLSRGDDVIFLAQGGLANHKYHMVKEKTTLKGVRVALFKHAARKRGGSSGKLVLVREVPVVQACVEIEFTYGIVNQHGPNFCLFLSLWHTQDPMLGGSLIAEVVVTWDWYLAPHGRAFCVFYYAASGNILKGISFPVEETVTVGQALRACREACTNANYLSPVVKLSNAYGWAANKKMPWCS